MKLFEVYEEGSEAKHSVLDETMAGITGNTMNATVCCF
jgi:hypothetical protein